MTGMFALALRNAAMGDDDDGVAWWDKIPDEVKERNIVIVLPPTVAAGEGIPNTKTGRYIKVPMPYGYNFFAVVANQLADTWRHSQDPKRGRDGFAATLKSVNAFLGAWVPVGELGKAIDNPKTALLAAVPDALNPIAQNLLNVNAFGRQLYPEDQPGHKTPDSARYFPAQAGTVFQRAAAGLASATGGSPYREGLIDMTPASLENLARGYGGGPVSFSLDLLNALYVRQSIARPSIDVARTPFVKQLYGQIDAEADRQVGYERLSKASEAADALARARRDGNVDEARLILKDSPLAGAGEAINATRSVLSELRKAELSIISNERLSEAEKYAQLQRLAVQRRIALQKFNAVYDRLQQRPR
jgi:hypothetical protein